MKRRKLTILLTVREQRDVPLGRTIVDVAKAVEAVSQAFVDEGLTVERSDVRGEELG